MSVYTKKQSKVIALTVIILLGIFLIYSMRILFSAVLASIIIYVLFRPMFIKLSVKNKISRPLAATIIILVSFIIIIIPFTFLISMLAAKIVYYKDHPETILQLISAAETFIGKNFDEATVQDALNSASQWAVGMLYSFFDTTAAIILTIAMMYFFLYFMYTKYEIFEGTLIKYMPFREKNSIHFANELKIMTFSNVVGQGIIALIQGLLLSLGFVIFNIPDPLFWGLICIFVSFLPVIGSATVFVPAGLIEILAGDTFSGYGILIYGFVIVANSDNLLRLWLNKWMGNIHPLITITGIIIGLPLFGILGLVFGPLLISTFILLIRMYEAAYYKPSTEKERVVPEDEISGIT